MNIELKNIINDYKNYLFKKNINIDNIDKNKVINRCEINANKELNKLEELSEEYKLYDSDYNDFMISMGKFAIALDSNLENKEKVKSFINIHKRFEEIEQINIMKDVYIWKYISRLN